MRAKKRLLLLLFCVTSLLLAEQDPPVGPGDPAAPHTERLHVTPDFPFINVFLTAGPYTQAQLKNWAPDGKLAICDEPAGITLSANAAHPTWQLFNKGQFPTVLGENLPLSKERQYMLVSFGLSTAEPGDRFLRMHTNYGMQLTGWQGSKQIFAQDAAAYNTTGTTVTLGKDPAIFTVQVEIGANPANLELVVLGANGAPSTNAHEATLSLPAGYGTEQLFAQGLIVAAPYPILDAKGAADIRAWGCSLKIPFAKKFTLTLHQGAKSLGRFDFDGSAALETRGISISVTPPTVGAAMDILVGVEIDGKELDRRVVKLYSLQGLRDKLTAFDVELPKAALAKSPNALFCRENIEMMLNAAIAQPGAMRASDAESLVKQFDEMNRLHAAEVAGEFPYAKKTGYSEQAYVAPQDGSVQPYLVYIPTSYSGDKAYPLAIYLHGYVPSYKPHNWIDNTQIAEYMAVMERNDCILVVPFGRSNTDFLQVGEADVLAVVQEMRKHYNIDPTKTYLYGYSMGGSGLYTMATHYPQYFAAGVVLAGRTDYYLWHRPTKALTPRFKQVMISRDNPIEQVGNLLHFPMQAHHGLQDLAVNIEHTHAMRDVLAPLHFTYEVKEYPEGSHFLGFDILGQDGPVQFLEKYQRTAPDDEDGYIKTWSSKFGERNNFAVLLAEDPTKPAIFAAHWQNAALIVTQFENVAVAEVRNVPLLKRGECKLTLPAGVEVDQEWQNLPETMSRLILTPKGATVGLKELQDATRRFKTPEMSGTVQDAFNGPFVITYGTVTDGEANKAKAEAWAQDWEEFAKGKATVLTDTAITDEIAAGHNLVLIGGPASHSYWAKIAGKLPVQVKDGVVTIGTVGDAANFKQVALGGNRGLLCIYPNPAAAGRYVVLAAGVRYGTSLPINHKLDLVPDVLIYSDKTMAGGDDTNTPVVGGFFNKEWQVEMKYFDVLEQP